MEINILIMGIKMKNRYRYIFLGFAILMVLSSCSAFQSSRKIDMAPFSDNAGILFGEAVKISRPFKWKHMKAYLNSTPEFQKLGLKAAPIIQSLSGIVYYSHQVVAINNSQISVKQKNRQLARYLSEILQKASEKVQLDSLGLDKKTLQDVFKKIPTSETYLDAIGEASPIITNVVLTIQNSLDELQDDIAVLVAVLDRRVEFDFADKRSNYDGLKALQSQYMSTLVLLYRNLMTNESNVDSLLRKDKSLVQFFPSSQNASIVQYEKANKYLLERLRHIDEVIKQMDYDVADYYAKQDEMEAWRLSVDDRIRIARNAISVWAQSHRNLGDGIPVPPMIDVAGIASGLAGTAAAVVIP